MKRKGEEKREIEIEKYRKQYKKDIRYNEKETFRLFSVFRQTHIAFRIQRGSPSLPEQIRR